MQILITSSHKLAKTRLALLSLCGLLLIALQPFNVVGQIGPRGGRPRGLPTGHSTVKGKVIYKDNLEPLKKVRLRVVSVGDDEDSELIVFANDRGEFRIDNLAAGKYYVSLEGPGVAMPSGFGMKLPVPLTAIPRREDFEPVIPRHDAEFEVDGTNNADIEIKIERGGKIAGKVLRSNGAGASDIAVALVSRQDLSGPYTSRFSTQTDKDGKYKFDNLPAGDYVVSAAVEGVTNAADLRARLRGDNQIVTYHPAATSIRDAQTVHVESGGSVNGVNITLVAREAFMVSGTLVRQRDGTAISGATVLLRNKESQVNGALMPGMNQRTVRTDDEGRWSFNNVMEGSYVVTALAPLVRSGNPNDEPADREQAFRQSRQRFLTAQQDVTVAGANLTDLLLSITGSGSISGIVALDSGQALPSGVVIFLELVREGGLPGMPLPVRVQPDGSFSISEVQGGDVYLSAALQEGAPFFVKSISANGSDPRSTPLKISEGTIAGPVQITLSRESGRLSGRVIVDKNQTVADVVVLLVPVEPDRQRFRTSYLTVRPAADGSYALTLPVGSYYILARHRDQIPGMISDEYVRNATQNADRVVLGPAEQKSVDVRVP